MTHTQSIRRVRPRVGPALAGAAAIVLATALTLLLDSGLVRETLRGRFADPDDAMRLVEVRAWLGGQSWFDMTATRLDPPNGSVLHWSRLVDLPAAALIQLLARITSPVWAERLAAVAVPTLWLAAFYGGMMRLATILCGRAALLTTLLGAFASGETLVVFGPGRIGHHAPETVALVFAVGAALAALEPRRAREAAVCGALIALSLAMSLETLPFDAVLVGILVILWIRRGQEQARMLAWLAGGLFAALPLCFAITVSPDRWLVSVCDAYGAPHLGAGMIAATGVMILALSSPRLDTLGRRLGAAGALAMAVIAYIGFAYPACLRSPFADVDPLVRDLWLRHVVESLPLTEFVRTRPMIGLAIVGPVALGLTAAVRAATVTRGVTSLRFALIAALSGTGVALAFWQVRVLASIAPIALCGGIYLVTRWSDRLRDRGLKGAAAVAPLAILAFSSTAWILVLPADVRSGADIEAAERKTACLEPEALAPLAGLAPGTAVAPLESGAHLLEATSLSVFAAPYHRNDDGNRYAFEVFLAAPEEARARLVGRGVTYVLTCPGTIDMGRLAARAPGGLAARLAAGAIPTFLRPLQVAGTPYRVYAVAPGGK